MQLKTHILDLEKIVEKERERNEKLEAANTDLHSQLQEQKKISERWLTVFSFVLNCFHSLFFFSLSPYNKAGIEK